MVQENISRSCRLAGKIRASLKIIVSTSVVGMALFAFSACTSQSAASASRSTPQTISTVQLDQSKTSDQVSVTLESVRLTSDGVGVRYSYRSSAGPILSLGTPSLVLPSGVSEDPRFVSAPENQSSSAIADGIVARFPAVAGSATQVVFRMPSLIVHRGGTTTVDLTIPRSLQSGSIPSSEMVADGQTFTVGPGLFQVTALGFSNGPGSSFKILVAPQNQAAKRMELGDAISGLSAVDGAGNPLSSTGVGTRWRPSPTREMETQQMGFSNVPDFSSGPLRVTFYGWGQLTAPFSFSVKLPRIG